jgi:hypothetical protein
MTWMRLSFRQNITPGSQENDVEYKIMRLKPPSNSDATVRLINPKD